MSKKNKVKANLGNQVEARPISDHASESTVPLLDDQVIPMSNIFDHEVTSVYAKDNMTYTHSTSSSVQPDFTSGHNIHSDEYHLEEPNTFSGGSSYKGKQGFIARSMLVPPAEFKQLEHEYTSGALEYGSHPESEDHNDGAVSVSIGAPESTTIYPSKDPNVIDSLDADISGNNSVNSEADSLMSSSHPNYTSTNNTSRDWLLNPYRTLLRKGHKLGELRATSICGNDAVGSILYMAGQCVSQAGYLAPVAVVIVAFVLYLFRDVYGEAVTALPLNGGAYNVLLNTTKKSTAAIAAVLTLLSYTATAVVSGTEAIHYLKHVINFDEKYLVYCIIGLLFFFAVLNFIGIGESAAVAMFIFILHIITLTLLAGATVVYLIRNGFGVLSENYHGQSAIQPNVFKAVLFGFSAAMLGVTGFETSSNYVEEQKPGVFVKTLRNMWWLCSIFNTLIIIATVCSVNLKEIIAAGQEATIIAHVAKAVGGSWLETFLCVDAFLVLAGGVLTSYVGVTGLVRRLAMDRCMPQFLLSTNECRGTNHWIIFGFFGLCASMYLMLNGDVSSLSQTYSISFLTVMGLFALGVMLLKVKRSTLVAEVTTSWLSASVGFFAVVIGLAGGIARDHTIVYVFFLYFLVSWLFIQVMFFRYQVLKLMSYFAKILPCSTCKNPEGRINQCLQRMQADIQNIPMGFFTKNGDISVLNKAILYIRENEDCSWLRIIHVFDEEANIPSTLNRDIHILNSQYPKLKIDLILVKGKFTPAMVAYVSVKLNINRNLLFITTPQPGFHHKLEDLGGVRLITH